MVMIANPQVAFSIFVLTEAWLVPLEGWPVDRFGESDSRRGGGSCRAEAIIGEP